MARKQQAVAVPAGGGLGDAARHDFLAPVFGQYPVQVAPPPGGGDAARHDFLAPVFDQHPIEVASAHGVWLLNTRGERVLDLYGGHAVAALGYGHEAWTAALARPAEPCQFQSHAVALKVRTRLARRLVRFSRLPIGGVFLVNSGAEANENALRVGLRRTGGG